MPGSTKAFKKTQRKPKQQLAGSPAVTRCHRGQGPQHLRQGSTALPLLLPQQASVAAVPAGERLRTGCPPASAAGLTPAPPPPAPLLTEQTLGQEGPAQGKEGRTNNGFVHLPASSALSLRNDGSCQLCGRRRAPGKGWDACRNRASHFQLAATYLHHTLPHPWPGFMQLCCKIP